MKLHLCSFVRIPILVLSVSFLLSVCALCADVTVRTHTYSAGAPVVTAAEVFRSVYEEEADIEILGPGTSFYFFYENIFRSTEKWVDFSALVPLTAPAGVDEGFLSAIASTEAVVVDFRDGDIYPGTVQITVDVSDFLASEESFSLYHYYVGEDKKVLLRPIASSMKASDGVLRLTMTEAHDYLLVKEGAEGAIDLSAYCYTPKVEREGFFAGANLGWILFFGVMGIALVALVIYLVTMKVITSRRNKKKALPKKRKG